MGPRESISTPRYAKSNGSRFKSEDTGESDSKRSGGKILRNLGEFVYKYSSRGKSKT